MNSKDLTKGISAAQWASMAKNAKISPEQLQSKYEAALTTHPQSDKQIKVKVTEGEKVQDCISKQFDFSLFDLVGVKGSVSFCGTSSSDWSAKVHLCLELAGSSVWCTDYTLSPSNLSVCFSPDLGAVKATLCIGITGVNHCFHVKGKACYWAFGWHCGDFDENIYCFG